jgi:MFS family permease
VEANAAAGRGEEGAAARAGGDATAGATFLAWPSPARAWYALGVFALALTINFLDRGILNLLIEPIKHDLGLTDVQMGVLTGFAYVLFYVLLGLPIARLADSRSRRLILGCGIAMWSVMTAVCGLAHNFWQLFVCRVGVGVGEACSGPATYSMMADLFPKEKLPRAISVLNFGFVSGTALALLVGCAAIHLVSNMPPVTLALLGTLRPWQLTFLLVSIPGFIVAALFTTVKEPIRRGRVAFGAAPGRAMPIREVIGFMLRNRRTYGAMFLALAFNSAAFLGIQAWTPPFFTREFGWTSAQVGLVFGLVLLVIAPVGLLCGSFLAEWYAKRGYADANLRVTLISFALVVPLAVAFPLMPTPELSVAMLALMFFVAMLNPGPQNAALQIITPNQMRGQVTALYLFIFNAVGFGTGSTIVAFVTDYLFRDESKVGLSMAAVAAVLGPLSAAFLWTGLKPYAESVARAREWG